jgi:hypothetical protein
MGPTGGSVAADEEEPTMPSTQFTIHTSLSPADVIELFTDFGADRASRWPNIDDAHFQVHDQGPGWAEVTEGNGIAWERERYTWDVAAGTVTIDTLDSNLWGPGSGWRYQLEAANGGTDVQVKLTRVAKTFRGKIIGALVPVLGKPTFRRQFQALLRKAEAR